jgi:serine/threonine protein kinase
VTPDLSSGETFGGYDIVAVAGSGGMGIVYRAVQRSLGRMVALKLIRSDVAESGDYRSRFQREARLAAAVDHPHVVSVFDAGEHADRLYLSMQWVDGMDLRAILEAESRLTPDRAIRLGTQLASALSAVHAAGLLHRDVKPTNILVRDIGGTDHAYLTDFGVAKMPDASDDLTRTGWIVGTSGYMSPEQIRGEQPTARSDLYSLACIVFQALTGERPFVGDNDAAARWAHANGPRPVASAVCPALGSQYDEFLRRALATAPGDRFSSGSDFAAGLESAHREQQAACTAASAEELTELRPRGPAEAIPAGASAREAGASSIVEPPAVPPAAQSQPSSPGEETLAPRATRLTTACPQSDASPPASRVRSLGLVIVLVSSIVFIALITLPGTSYVEDRPSGTYRSLQYATSGDINSPLRAQDFWILIALVCVVPVVSATSLLVHRPVAVPAAAAASLGLIGYSLYLPFFVGKGYGFGSYGWSYWLSLAAAVVMLIATGGACVSVDPSTEMARW